VILKSILLENFRQFKGEQLIEFDSDKNKNVTVIFGENGRGKTGIFRALMFCLYGKKKLSQDASVDESELHLVNSQELEDKSNEGKPVESSVTVEFEHENRKYKLKRSLLGILDEGRVIEQNHGVKLTIWDEEGNTSIKKAPELVKERIENILSPALREYFLFDGEKIERLTRASTEQRREISQAIRKLLNIDTLEKVIGATMKLSRYFNRELEKKATGERAAIMRLQRKNEEEIETGNREVDSINRELELARKEKIEVDKELEQIREIQDLLTIRTDLEVRLKDTEEGKNDILRAVKGLAGPTALLLLRNTANNVFQNIDRRKQAHEIPSDIRKDLIDRILSEMECICGRKIEENSEAYSRILEWRNRIPDNVTEDLTLNLWRDLSSARDQFENIEESAIQILTKFATLKNDQRELERKLEELRMKIGSSERADASRLDAHRLGIDRKILKLQHELSITSKKLDALHDERRQLTVRRKTIEDEEGIRDELTRRGDLVEQSLVALNRIHDDFTAESRVSLGDNASVYLSDILDEESRRNLKSIRVEEDYSIQIHDRWGKPFLANISAGQRQIMSIAFIAALAKAACGGLDFLEMPLFMDTPFGRLSHEHRKNLVQKVPHWCSQWILLATDTEFRDFEAQALAKTGTWKSFYILSARKDGSTEIHKTTMEDALGYICQKGKGD